MVKKSKNIISFLAKLFFIVLLIQLCVTYLYTNTKRFSITSLIFVAIAESNISYLANNQSIESNLDIVKSTVTHGLILSPK